MFICKTSLQNCAIVTRGLFLQSLDNKRTRKAVVVFIQVRGFNSFEVTHVTRCSLGTTLLFFKRFWCKYLIAGANDFERFSHFHSFFLSFRISIPGRPAPTSAAEDSPPPPPPPRPGSKTTANKVCVMVVMLQSTIYHASLDIWIAAVSKFESNYENRSRINLGLHVFIEGVFFSFFHTVFSLRPSI